MAYIQGEPRNQTSLFPTSIEDLVPEDHLVRVIDAYIARLDLQMLGFDKARPKATGRPPYNPADLLKLYVYGYFFQIRSSRRLEAECQRNVEVMWLLNRLTPDFKTIADFRRDNGIAFAATCRAFVQFCRTAGLVKGDLVAIDGSKFKAVASNRRYVSSKHLKRDLEKLDQRIARYLSTLDEMDQEDGADEINRTAVKAALANLQSRRIDNLTSQALMETMGITQMVCGEDEARMTRAPQGTFIGYNVQSAVDAEHGLVVHHDVVQDSDDRRQLAPMAIATAQVLEQPTLTVTADAGYSNGEHFQACDEVGITAIVPINRGNRAAGGTAPLAQDDFKYDPETDTYECPAGQTLTLTQLNKGTRIYHAQATACGSCALKGACTKAQRRGLKRHVHEPAFERMAKRLKAHPEMMGRRRSIVEHPFGNLKQWALGTGRFLLRQMQGARTEMALAVTSYNLKRAFNILGARRLLEVIA